MNSQSKMVVTLGNPFTPKDGGGGWVQGPFQCLLKNLSTEFEIRILDYQMMTMGLKSFLEGFRETRRYLPAALRSDCLLLQSFF